MLLKNLLAVAAAAPVIHKTSVMGTNPVEPGDTPERKLLRKT